MKYLFICITLLFGILFAELPDGNEILKAIDENVYSGSIITTSRMVINGRRATRTVSSINYSQGNEKSFSEYLSPPRDKGTKMLKLDDNLWIYNPSSDRIVQISGNMLKQSVMGSDLSYEDFMDEVELTELYTALVSGETTYLERDCWILELIAKRSDVSYEKKKFYVDKEKSIPLYEEWYAQSGKLLKSVKVLDTDQSGNRWYAKQAVFKDELKEGKGTEFFIDEIEFDATIPELMFTKAMLKK
ncbi:MAG: outer membrane lipoprotein-sorting protein [Candidatus Cloacimonetes bacterium]|nr:outer membrane lipoprotein-sorting protein [Candidatus Cloacimonadota bacterium]